MGYKCAICGKEYEVITSSHLATHGMTVQDYRDKHPDSVAGLAKPPRCVPSSMDEITSYETEKKGREKYHPSGNKPKFPVFTSRKRR